MCKSITFLILLDPLVVYELIIINVIIRRRQRIITRFVNSRNEFTYSVFRLQFCVQFSTNSSLDDR